MSCTFICWTRSNSSRDMSNLNKKIKSLLPSPYIISKGGSLKKMIAELHGKVTGCAKVLRFNTSSI